MFQPWEDTKIQPKNEKIPDEQKPLKPVALLT